MIKLAVAVLFLAVDFYTYTFFATDPVIPARRTFDEFPLRLEDWKCKQRETMSDEVEANLGVTDYLICTYTRSGTTSRVGVYVGYHESQVREEGGGAGENSIHPPEHCLPGAGWDVIDHQVSEIDFPGLPGGNTGKMNRLIIAKGEHRQLVYYWYQSRGRVIESGWKKIFYVGVDRALRQRTDGSLVRFTIPVTKKEKRAEKLFQDLAPLIVAQLPDYIPE